jgi:hypothetical protein
MAVITQIQLRRGTAATWTANNPTLAAGEFGFETDTRKAKIGDGVTAWNSLAYALTGATGTVTSVAGGTGLTGGTITSTGTLAIDTSVVATLTGTQTLTNKTLTSPVIGTIVNTGTLTLPTSTDTLVGRATTDTLTNKTLTAPVVTYSINTQTGTTFTPALSDAASIVTLNNAGAISLTIPTNASVAYAIGTQLNFIQIGAGQVTITAVTPGTTTIASTGATSTAPKIRVQNAMATCIKVATDTWYVTGDIA